MTTTFKDYFSKQANDYARYRPSYPHALFEFLADVAYAHEAAWDCATGNGQVALGLTPHFHRIYATDASETQIGQAFQHESIEYQVAPAEQTTLPARSIDLVTVGQALHWFKMEQFYEEVYRIGKPTSAIAVWCYGLIEIPTAAEPVREHLQAFHTLTRPFWPPEITWIEQQYRTIPFPFQELSVPDLTMTAAWTVKELIGYLSTYSATHRLIEQHGIEPIAALFEQLTQSWGTTEVVHPIQWPLYMRVGRLSFSSTLTRRSR
jgi:ubiquinone/menaquinone biosynthesis C-methylase UbiE